MLSKKCNLVVPQGHIDFEKRVVKSAKKGRSKLDEIKRRCRVSGLVGNVRDFEDFCALEESHRT